MAEHIVKVRGLTKSFGNTEVLKGVDVDIEENKLTTLVGQSGSGKTTLLDMMSSVGQPDTGSIEVRGFGLEFRMGVRERFKSRVGNFLRITSLMHQPDRLVRSADSWLDIANLTDEQRSEYRSYNGQVFQQSGLLMGLMAKDNIEVAHLLSGRKIDREWVDHLVGILGVQGIMKKRVAELSGGQAQRIGIIRALAHRPRLVFADEPTASLDPKLKDEVHDTLSQITKESTTVIIASHEESIKNFADRAIVMEGGYVMTEGQSPQHTKYSDDIERMSGV